MARALIMICLLFPFWYALCQGTVTFVDDFKTNKHNWLMCKNTELEAAITPKGYTLNNKSDLEQNAYHDLPMNPAADFTIEAILTRDFSKETYGFGIMFGGDGPGNLYEFLIESTGYYTFFKYEDYKYAEILPWKEVSGINPIGQQNALRVEHRQGTLHFFINGTEVTQFSNYKAMGSLYGLVVGRQSGITVHRLAVTYSPVTRPIVKLDTTALPDNFILKEDFDDNYMQWDNHKGHSEVKNGFYELSNPKESYLFWEDYAMFKVHDYSVESELRLISGSHVSPYGLLLGIKGWAGDYLQFSITANGFFRLTRNVDWEEETLVPWKFSSTIKSSAANVITVSRRNKSLYFYVNGVQVLKHADVKLAGNGVGWILTNDVRKVRVNYIRIRQPLHAVTNVADMTVSDRERLTANINSSAEEFGPVISPDGNSLYFTRDDNPGIQGLEKDDIWYSEYQDNQWSPATKMPAPLNNAGNCAVVSVSADNQTLLLRGDYDNDKTTVKESLYISHRTGENWERPAKVVIRGFRNKDHEEDFCLSNEETILISSIENNTSLGERDLYVSFLQPDNTWSEPANLGNVVNTTSNEFSPFLAADNTTLYYSSFGMPSYGKADIYVTRRLDDTWKNWSPPQNLGPIINTDLNDQGFTLAASGTEAYLSSEQNTAGKADIFKVKLPPPLQPEPVVLIYGKVYDSGTGKTIGSEIVYEDLASDEGRGRTRSDPNTGDYKIVLPYGEHYGLNASRDGYLPMSASVDIVEEKPYQEIELDLYLVPLRAGQNIVLNNLFFVAGSPEIVMKSYAELRKMVAIVKQYPSMKFTIAGHTDDGNGESARYLQKLSERRAEAVKNYFVTHGIQAERISTVGYGKDKPVAANDSNENRQKNRRVEFIVDAL